MNGSWVPLAIEAVIEPCHEHCPHFCLILTLAHTMDLLEPVQRLATTNGERARKKGNEGASYDWNSLLRKGNDFSPAGRAGDSFFPGFNA
jgi:hypothetical protein